MPNQGQRFPRCRHQHGIILIGACVVEAIASALRSLIFTGIANRVDMATRESILIAWCGCPRDSSTPGPSGRSPITSTNSTVYANFWWGLPSPVPLFQLQLYLAVLLSLNPLLTLVTLSTLPLFIVLALIVTIVDYQIGRTVEEGMNTTAILQTLTGIQTIKSQNASQNPLGISEPLQPLHRRRLQAEDHRRDDRCPRQVPGRTVGHRHDGGGRLADRLHELTIGALFAASPGARSPAR